MNSDYKDKRTVKSQGVLSSFTNAIKGIHTALTSERNMKIHSAMAVIVMVLGFFLRLSATEWLFILSAIGGVIALELVNTAVEKVVDLVTSDFHPLAKQAKDICAGAVFVYAVLSVIIGIIIFLPKLIKIVL